jgi:hypothetical protein
MSGSFDVSDYDNQVFEDPVIAMEKAAKRQRYLLIHGWVMWGCWGLLGFMMVLSNRYLKHRWRLNMLIHSICGTAIFILNLLYGLGAIYYLDWKIAKTIHGIVGSLLAIILPVVCLEGMISRILFKRLRWNSAILIKIQVSHKVSKIYSLQ